MTTWVARVERERWLWWCTQAYLVQYTLYPASLIVIVTCRTPYSEHRVRPNNFKSNLIDWSCFPKSRWLTLPILAHSLSDNLIIEYKKTFYIGFLFRMYVVNLVLQINKDYGIELKLESDESFKAKCRDSIWMLIRGCNPNLSVQSTEYLETHTVHCLVLFEIFCEKIEQVAWYLLKNTIAMINNLSVHNNYLLETTYTSYLFSLTEDWERKPISVNYETITILRYWRCLLLAVGSLIMVCV